MPTDMGGEPLASNTMPRCKYGLACRIIDPKVEGTANLPLSEQHWYKFQHPCYWCCAEGHPELGPPGIFCPLDAKLGPPCMESMIIPCTNFDPDHRRCFRHPIDDVVVEEVLDEAADELDQQVVADEAAWSAPEVGTVSEDQATDAKMEAAEAAANGDLAAAVLGYTKAIAGGLASALTYAKRADCLLKLGHPTAAVDDCKRAVELNPDSAKAYKVMAKALARKGSWAEAYAQLCVGNKIDSDEDSAALQKSMAAKVEREKKLSAQRAKRADAFFASLSLSDAWASLEIDVAERTGGNASIDALRKWNADDPNSLAERLEALSVDEGKRAELLEKLAAA